MDKQSFVEHYTQHMPSEQKLDFIMRLDDVLEDIFTQKDVDNAIEEGRREAVAEMKEYLNGF